MAEDPWAAFRVAPTASVDDPWAEFRASDGAPLQGRPFVPRPETQGRDNNLVEIGKDVGRVALGGLTTGAMVVPDIANMARSGFNAGLDKLMPPTAAQLAAKEAAPQPIGSKEALAAVERSTGLDTRPEAATTEVGKTAAPYVKTAAEFVPLAVATGGGAIAGGVVPGLASEAFGQLTKGKWYEPLARIAGGVAAAPTAARVITPAPAAPERQALVDILRSEGVVTPTQTPIPFIGQPGLTAGQATGSGPVRWAESALGDIGGGRASAIADRGKEQFAEAALRRIGENANRTTPEVMDRALTRIENTFNDVAARNTVSADRQFANDIAATQQDYHLLANPLQRQVVDNAINDVIGVIQRGNGVIPGDVYQAMRSRLNAAGRASAGSDNQLSQAMFGIMNALDGAMERSLAAAGNSADAEAWRTARREYRNYLPLEKAASAAGADAAEGLLSPQALRGAVVNQNRRAYVRGDGDYADLARAGAGIITTPPNSGTPARTYMTNLLPTLLSGGALGGVIAGAPGAAAGTAAALSPILLGRTLMSRPMQAYLANQAVPATAREQMVRALLEGGAAERQ